jgi:hypothetical protein
MLKLWNGTLSTLPACERKRCSFDLDEPVSDSDILLIMIKVAWRLVCAFLYKPNDTREV